MSNEAVLTDVELYLRSYRPRSFERTMGIRKRPVTAKRELWKGPGSCKMMLRHYRPITTPLLIAVYKYTHTYKRTVRLLSNEQFEVCDKLKNSITKGWTLLHRCNNRDGAEFLILLHVNKYWTCQTLVSHGSYGVVKGTPTYVCNVIIAQNVQLFCVGESWFSTATLWALVSCVIQVMKRCFCVYSARYF